MGELGDRATTLLFEALVRRRTNLYAELTRDWNTPAGLPSLKA